MLASSSRIRECQFFQKPLAFVSFLAVASTAPPAITAGDNRRMDLGGFEKQQKLQKETLFDDQKNGSAESLTDAQNEKRDSLVLITPNEPLTKVA